MASLPTPLALSTPPMAATSPSLPLTTITSLSAIGTSDGGTASRLAAFPATVLATWPATASSRSRLPLPSLPLAQEAGPLPPITIASPAGAASHLEAHPATGSASGVGLPPATASSSQRRLSIAAAFRAVARASKSTAATAAVVPSRPPSHHLYTRKLMHGSKSFELPSATLMSGCTFNKLIFLAR